VAGVRSGLHCPALHAIPALTLFHLPEIDMRKICFLVVVTLFLVACGKPVPPERSAYVGDWRSPQMAILITQDGSVAYKRLERGVTTSISGPLKGFDGDNFVVGMGPVVTTFEVSEAPRKDGDVWRMTVDGVELQRVQ